MKVTFLGTGTSHGVPMIGCTCEVCTSTNSKDNRLRSSVLIETEGKTIIIDTGPDFRQQMLKAKVKHLDAILYTHEHKDHIAGLDDTRAFSEMYPLSVYAVKRVQDAIRGAFSYIFQGLTYPGIPKVEMHEIRENPFFVDTIPVIPINVLHYKLPVLGFRIHSFCYITDCNHIPDDEFEKLKGLDVLVLNALRIEPHISHYSLEEAISMAVKIGAKQTYFTHISHQLGLHDEVEKGLPRNIHLSYDGLALEL